MTFKIMPFSFPEMCEIKGIREENVSDEHFTDYLNYGGMPQRFLMQSETIYNELIHRGYDVYVGMTVTGEIDFVVMDGDERTYYQVAYLLADEKVIRR